MAEKDAVKEEAESKGNVSSEAMEVSKPAVVRFPAAGTTTVPALKLEADELEQDTSPVVLWQVYAIGGFLVLRWILERWKERRGNSNPSNEDSPSPGAGADEANE